MKLLRNLTSAALLASLSVLPSWAQPLVQSENIEIIAKMTMRPGNVTATKNGRVFTTIHPMGGEFGLQLAEIIKGEVVPWPSTIFQAKKGHYSDAVLDAPLGITKDGQGGIWVIDAGVRVGKARIWGFDIASGDLIQKIDIPLNIVPKGSFAQDLVVDRAKGWAYVAELATRSLVAVNLTTGKARAFSCHPSLQPDKDARLVFDGKELHFFGNPARNGINPITLSADGETLYFGPMTGRGWFSVPAKLFREGADDKAIAAAIRKVGEKPLSDGATTDGKGNHYFTNLMENGIDKLDSQGRLTPLIRDDRLDWPDNVQMGETGILYIAVNQLHKSAPATGEGDKGTAPYYILRATLP